MARYVDLPSTITVDRPGDDEKPLSYNKNLILSLSVHAVNTTVGPNGITPSLLVFGAIPRLPIGGLNILPSVVFMLVYP